MRPVDLSPVAPDQQTERASDLFLIFAGANIVATTLQVGASLPTTLPSAVALAVVLVGSLAGAALVAALAPIGSRFGVPSIVAARAALGLAGARLLAGLLFVTNFAWIALNNEIAASVSVAVTGLGAASLWAAGLGVVATLIVVGGPRIAAQVDRVVVPMLFAAGIVFTVACMRAPRIDWTSGIVRAADVVTGFDMVVGYQASWLLMFADYPRFVRNGRAAATAVFLGLGLTASWFMPLGLIGSLVAQSADPGHMVTALELGWWGAVLFILATLTTNFVNIYMSALALKSLRPSLPDGVAIWMIGGGGAALGLLSDGWLAQFGDFMLVLAGALVPIGGILLAHFVLLRRPVDVASLYDERGPLASRGGWSLAGMSAWVTGAVVSSAAQGFGATLPALAASTLIYVVVTRALALPVSEGARRES